MERLAEIAFFIPILLASSRFLWYLECNTKSTVRGKYSIKYIFKLQKQCHLRQLITVKDMTPLNLLLLTTEGKHSPDWRDHLLGYSTGFSICSLLFTGERCEHLYTDKRWWCIQSPGCFKHQKHRDKLLQQLTILKRAAEMPSTGLTARMTRVSFQPLLKPMIKDTTKLVKPWISIPTLSPIPSWIL